MVSAIKRPGDLIRPRRTSRNASRHLLAKSVLWAALKTIRLTQTQRLLCDLIAIPSVNPAFMPDSGLAAGEETIAEYLATALAKAGLPVEFQEVFPHRPNIWTQLVPTGKARSRVLLAPHLDTVGQPGEWTDMFKPQVKGGRILGRGACDTKGSVAAMLTALFRLARAGQRPAHTEIVFAGLVDEENAQAGSRAVVEKGYRADLAIVGEPTLGRIVTAHKGDVWLRLDTRGKAAHGARPELGRNAVHAMAKIVDIIETEYAAMLQTHRHPLLGRATVNVGSIQGGTQPNIVPAECFITIDRRTLPGENEALVRKEVRALLRAHALSATLGSARTAPCLPMETDLTLPMVHQLLAVARQQTGLGVDFFCDAAVLSHGGIPSVVFGPGDIAQAHTNLEWVSTASLESATDLLERFLRSLP